MVPFLTPLSQLQAKGNIGHGEGYRRGYVGSYSAMPTQIQQQKLQQWVVDMQESAEEEQSNSEEVNYGPQLFGQEILPSFVPVTKKGEPAISTEEDSPYFNELPLPMSLRNRQQGFETDNKNIGSNEQINQQFYDDEFQQFQLQRQMEAEKQKYMRRESQSDIREDQQRQREVHHHLVSQKCENKLEDTTKSHLKSQRSNEEHKQSKISKELSNLISNQQNRIVELQQIHQNSLQVEASREQKAYNNYSQQLELFNRLEQQQQKSQSGKSSKYKQKKAVYTALTNYMKKDKKQGHKTQANKSIKSSDYHHSYSQQEVYHQQNHQRQQQNNQEETMRQEELSEKQIQSNWINSHYVSQMISQPFGSSQPKEQHGSSKDHSPIRQLFNNYHYPKESHQSEQNYGYKHPNSINKSNQQQRLMNKSQKYSYKNKHTKAKELSKASSTNRAPQKDSIKIAVREERKQTRERKSKHPSIFLKNKNTAQAEPACSFRIAKIHELANLVPQHQQDISEFKQHYEPQECGISSERNERNEYSQGEFIPQLFANQFNSEKQQIEQYRLAEREAEPWSEKVCGTDVNKKSSVYGRQYTNKKQYNTVQKTQKKTIKNKKSKDNHFNSEIIESLPHDMNHNNDGNSIEHNAPQTERNKSKEVHIWSFSDLLSQEDIRGLSNRKEESQVSGSKGMSKKDSYKAENDQRYQNFVMFKKQNKVSDSFPKYGQNYQGQHDDNANMKMNQYENEIKHKTQNLKHPNNSLQEEHLLKLMGGSDKLKQLSSLALESKDSADWNEHNLKQQLSRFLKQNKIPFEENQHYEGQQEDVSLFSSPFHMDSHNVTAFNLQEALKDNSHIASSKYQPGYTHSYPNQQLDNLIQEGISDHRKFQLPRREGNSWLDEVDMEVIEELQSNNMPSSTKTSQFQFSINDPRQFRHHFHPRKQAIQRFIHSNTGSIEERRKAVQSRQKGYDSLSPYRELTGLGFLKRKKDRLDKNLTRFNTRLHKY